MYNGTALERDRSALDIEINLSSGHSPARHLDNCKRRGNSKHVGALKKWKKYVQLLDFAYPVIGFEYFSKSDHFTNLTSFFKTNKNLSLF